MIAFDRLPKNIFDSFLVVSQDTGEIVDILAKKPIISNVNGVKTRAFIFDLFGTRHLAITFNSKMATSKNGEFPPLDVTTFRSAFDYVQRLFGFTISYENFLTSSKVFDCDFKTDFNMLQTDFNWLVKHYSAIPSAKTYMMRKGKMLDVSLGYSGIEFVNRKDATVSQPFVKFYSKLEELEVRSPDYKHHFHPFFNNYNYRRLEVTVKNARAFEQLYKKGLLRNEKQTLLEILSIPQWRCRLIIMDLLEKHANQNYKTAVNLSPVTDKPTPTDFFIGELVAELMENGYTLRNCIGLMEKFPANDKTKAVAKSRLKSRMVKGVRFARLTRKVDSIRLTQKDAWLD